MLLRMFKYNEKKHLSSHLEIPTAYKLYNDPLVKEMCREVIEIVEDNGEIGGLVEESI